MLCVPCFCVLLCVVRATAFDEFARYMDVFGGGVHGWAAGTRVRSTAPHYYPSLVCPFSTVQKSTLLFTSPYGLSSSFFVYEFPPWIGRGFRGQSSARRDNSLWCITIQAKSRIIMYITCTTTVVEESIN
ncbi:hypothetical protein SODALDRAFT_28658 [Sodiomyces alkalinus F11]|uniref:Secreted protein n=1 Tax=Sodiomyces alkalinus (strain CBS 110278 / VKM F-3762 / F11) TaxID=1314773 RepID=A0A3N2Q8C7_SODAK|nr:hypothetical protein SODALDRAFT_28658 [Sodiomyces alkalinus F11]ROT43024.1 hypothetical protein SODALDRAFT_28658 [Sodiomyces alkalinus F11]